MAASEGGSGEHHLSNFLQGLANLARPATNEVLVARLHEGNLPMVQSKACQMLAKHAKESPEQMQQIKALGAAEALEALHRRTHHESVRIAALEALVVLQAKAAVQPLVEIMQSEATDNKHRDLKNWAADSLHGLLREKGSYQKLARDSGAIQAVVKMERRDSTKELLQWLGPEDSHHVRGSRSSMRDLRTSRLNIPESFPETEDEEQPEDAAADLAGTSKAAPNSMTVT